MLDCDKNLSLSIVQALPQILILMLREHLSSTVGKPGASFERLLYNSLKLLGWADKHEHILVCPDPPFAVKLRNICLHLPSKLETQTASAAKHSSVHCRLPIWVTRVSPDGKSRALAVMQLADNTFPTILISCKRFIHSE